MTSTRTFILPTSTAQAIVSFTNDFTYFDAEVAETIDVTTRILISSDGDDAQEELEEYVKRLTAFADIKKGDEYIDDLITKSDDRLKDHSTLVGFIVSNVTIQDQDSLVYLIKNMIKTDYISVDEFVHQFIVP